MPPSQRMFRLLSSEMRVLVHSGTDKSIKPTFDRRGISIFGQQPSRGRSPLRPSRDTQPLHAVVCTFTANELSSQKAACRVTGWTAAASCSSHYQPHHLHQQHGAPDRWTLDLRQYPYLYTTDRDDRDGARQLARFPRCDVATGAYEPPFIDCSHLFTNNHHQQDDHVTHLQNGSRRDFQKDSYWHAATEYQLNHNSPCSSSHSVKSQFGLIALHLHKFYYRAALC